MDTRTAPILTLPNAPHLPGRTFRRLRDETDYVHMAAVHAGSQAWNRIDPLSARESIPTAKDLADTVPEGEARDNPNMLLAQVDDYVVGFVFSRISTDIGTIPEVAVRNA